MMIEIEQRTSYEEWLSKGEHLRDADRDHQFQIGDWLNGHEATWGDMYEDASRLTGLDYNVLAEYKSVAGSIQFLLRNKNLSYSHHKVVAPYKPHEQRALLEKAVTLGLSVKQLREQKDSLLPKGIETGQVWKLGAHLLYCGDSASATFINLCKQAEASFAFADPPYNAGVAEWDNDFTWQHDYLSEVAPIVAVTPGISAIKDFMQVTSMPYKWSMSYWIDNGMTRGALGFGNWIFVALFTNGSLYRNEQDLERISITGNDHELKHKGRKPIEMLRHIVKLYTQEGQTVIDPFLGTGTTLVACEELGRSCIGAELNVEYCESIVKRWERLTECEAVQWL